MPIVDAYYERKFQRVTQSTWGHLRAKPGERFKVRIVFGRDVFGNEYVAAMDQPEGLADSPWLYEDTWGLVEAELDKIDERYGDHHKTRGTLWQFDGEYVVYKNQKRKFVGRVRRVRISKPVKR